MVWNDSEVRLRKKSGVVLRFLFEWTFQTRYLLFGKVFYLDYLCIKQYFCHARKIFNILLITVPTCCFPDVAGSYSLHCNQGLIIAALVGRVTPVGTHVVILILQLCGSMKVNLEIIFCLRFTYHSNLVCSVIIASRC